MKDIEISAIKSKVKEITETTIKELINIQFNQAMMLHNSYVDNNHFYGVINEEIEEIKESFDFLLKDYKEVESKVFKNKLNCNSLILADLENTCKNTIVEIAQVLACIKKYKKCFSDKKQT